jgi:hypothetical protein
MRPEHDLSSRRPNKPRGRVPVKAESPMRRRLVASLKTTSRIVGRGWKPLALALLNSKRPIAIRMRLFPPLLGAVTLSDGVSG